MRKDVDVIHVTSEELKKILEWRDNNKEAVRNFKNVLEEGIIASHNFGASIYFKVSDDFVDYEYYYLDFKTNKNVLVLKALVKRVGEKFHIIKQGNMPDYTTDQKKIDFLVSIGMMDKEDTLSVFLIDNTTIHASIMAYITYKSSEVEIIEEDFMSPERLKKAERHNKYNPTNKIKIKKKVIRLKNPKFKNVTKREMKRVTESWGVRGHPRIRNGKQEWVRPYTKGKGARKAKKYSVEVE